MKHNLGRILLPLILLLSVVLLQAEDFVYQFHLSKKDPYVKEPVVLTLDLNQTNHDAVMLFNFNLKNSKDYSFQRIDIEESDSYHNMKIRYFYLLYPLRPGDININFELIKKTTTDESIAYSFSGDRDHIKGIVTTDTKIDLAPLHLQAKPLPEKTLLVGDFKLTYTIKKHKAKAYEPLPVQISIKGTGYPPLVDSILPEEGNFTRFTENPVVSSFPSLKGTHSTITYPMALSHTQNFTLAAIQLNAFNPKTQKSYTLEMPAQKFEIQEVKVKSLVDKIDSPEEVKEDWSWLYSFLSYVIVFFSGYLTAVSWRWGKRQSRKKEHPLIGKIEACKEEKALLQLLMATNNQRFNPIIEKLENTLYANSKVNFKQIKQEALATILKEEQR